MELTFKTQKYIFVSFLLIINISLDEVCIDPQTDSNYKFESCVTPK